MKSKWRKSSYSTAQGNCVEVADQGTRVLVRDTKNRSRAMLRFTPDAWASFTGSVKAGRPLGPLARLTGVLGASADLKWVPLRMSRRVHRWRKPVSPPSLENGMLVPVQLCPLIIAL
jgi:hypothetical protein